MSKHRDLWLGIALAVLAALVFAPAITGSWIFDDHALIEQNARVHTLGAAGSWFGSDFWSGVSVANRLQYWRPLISATYAIDWQLSGGSPAWFHLTNLVVHALVAVLAFVTLRRWTASSWAAFAAAAVWAVHPTKAENVAWISGRTDVVCAAFVLVALLGIARRLRGAWRTGLVLEIAGTAGAYMAKELAIVLPVLAAVEAWAAAGRPAIDRALIRPVARAAAPQAVVAAVYLVAHSVWLPIAAPAPLGLVDHARTVLETYGRFIALTFAPHALSVQQALVRTHDGAFVFSGAYVALGALAALVTLAAIVVARRRFPAACVGVAVFALTLVPTLNIARTNQHTLVAERFLYIPTLGLALVLAAALARRRRYVAIVTGAVIAALAMLALSRAADFGNETAFWDRELALHPDSPAGLEFVLTTEVQQHALAQISDATERDHDQGAFAADVVEIFARSSSDHDGVAELVQACDELLAPAHPTTLVHALGVTVTIDTGPAYRPQTVRIQLARAELAGRLGDLASARAAATEASTACDGCAAATLALARVQAREAALGPPAAADAGFQRALEIAGPLDERARILEARKAAAAVAGSHGAAQLQQRATELSAVGLWGAAYAVLEPRFGEITRDPRASASLAKLAFRAGELIDAVDALAVAIPAAEIRPTLERWATETGWITSASGPRSP